MKKEKYLKIIDILYRIFLLVFVIISDIALFIARENITKPTFFLAGILNMIAIYLFLELFNKNEKDDTPKEGAE